MVLAPRPTLMVLPKVVIELPAVPPANSVVWFSGRSSEVTVSRNKNPEPVPVAERSAMMSGRIGIVVVPAKPVPCVPG